MSNKESTVWMAVVIVFVALFIAFEIAQYHRQTYLLKENARLRAEIDKPSPPIQDIPGPSGSIFDD